jgi:RNA polymerase sigma-70 factor (ECF subfamily)
VVKVVERHNKLRMNPPQGYHVPPPEIKEEEEHINAAKKDSEKFKPLYEKYFEPIFRFVYQRLDDKDIANDITQQTFINALLNIKKYQHRGLPFSSWLYRIAVNELNKSFKAQKNIRTINIETAGLENIFEEIEEQPYQEYNDKLKKVLTELEPDNLLLIEMRFFEKRSFKEIGNILSITENNAKVRLYRLLDKIKKVLK